jgi:hypothetical protein
MESFRIDVIEQAGTKAVHITFPAGTPVYIHHDNSAPKSGPSKHTAIYEQMKKHPNISWSPTKLKEMFGVDKRDGWFALDYLLKSGFVRKEGRGDYRIINEEC